MSKNSYLPEVESFLARGGRTTSETIAFRKYIDRRLTFALISCGVGRNRKGYILLSTTITRRIVAVRRQAFRAWDITRVARQEWAKTFLAVLEYQARDMDDWLKRNAGEITSPAEARVRDQYYAYLEQSPPC